MSAKFMFQPYRTLSVTKMMARVKCATLILRNLVVLTLGLYQIVLSWGNLNPLMRLVILKLHVVILEGSFAQKKIFKHLVHFFH